MKKTTFILLTTILLVSINKARVDSYPVNSDFIEESASIKENTRKKETIRLITSEPVKIMILLIALPGHPRFDNSWPEIKNPNNFPDENWPLLGTFPDGQRLRDYVNPENSGSIPVDFWYKNQIEDYYRINSNGKYEVEVVFPKTPDNKVFETNKSYDEWLNINKGEKDGLVSRYNNWKNMAAEVIEKVYTLDQSAFNDIALINFVYLVNNNEYSVDNYSAFSFDIPFTFTLNNSNTEIYTGHVITTYALKVILHESLHRIGSMVGEPDGFEGLPDRTTLSLLSFPENMTWGYDVMYNKGFFSSENALYGAPPMLTTDRIFLEWIEPDEVFVVNMSNVKGIKLKDVNQPLSDNERLDEFYRVVKVMIHEDYYNELDEYFILEFRNGTDFDRNFYNIYETEPHKGVLIWHVKENTNMINRTRQHDHHIDLEVAVPYNGWNDNPIPDDDFPRNYYRPYSWRSEINGAGDYDYYDDNSSNPPYPDGGVHRWELTDDSHPEWAPYYVRRNTLRSNFFTNEPVRGIITNTFSNNTRPSSKDWSGNPTYITIENITKVDDYMSLDVLYTGGVLDVHDSHKILTYNLEANYPNPFNPETTIKYSIPAESHVEIKITNLLGQTEAVLYNDIQSAGNHSIVFNGSDLSSGVYLYSLKSNDFIQTRKMLLIK